MNDIVAKRFHSRFDLAGMLAILKAQAAHLAGWQIRDSEYGDYIRGTNLGGAKIRITRVGTAYEVEIWFDSDHQSKTSPQERLDLVRTVDQLLIGHLGAWGLADA